jgi:hypothetical protein
MDDPFNVRDGDGNRIPWQPATEEEFTGAVLTSAWGGGSGGGPSTGGAEYRSADGALILRRHRVDHVETLWKRIP